MAVMKTHTEYTLDAMVELQQVVCTALIPRETWSRRTGNLAWSLCFLGSGGYLAALGVAMPLAVVLLMLGGTLMTRYLMFFRLQARKAISRMPAEARSVDFVFESNSIRAYQENSSAAYPYGSCTHLLETDAGFYFIMEDGQGILLEKAGLKGGTPGELRAFLQRKTGKDAQTVSLNKRKF